MIVHAKGRCRGIHGREPTRQDFLICDLIDFGCACVLARICGIYAVNILSQQHNVRIGERTAEAIKCAIGAAIPKLEEEPEDFTVTGPNMLTALPQSVTLNYNEIAYALEKSLIKLDAALMKVLETMPPELYADIVKNGIYLAGGGALIKGLDRRLTEKTGLPFHIAEDPLRAIARGTGIALKNIDRFSFLMK